MGRTLIYISGFIMALSACKNQSGMSRSEDSNKESKAMTATMPRDQVKTPSDPIPMSACRLFAIWQETGEGENSSVIQVVKFVGTGSAYSGYRPNNDDVLLVHDLVQEQFIDRDTLEVDLQPFQDQPGADNHGLREMGLIKIVK